MSEAPSGAAPSRPWSTLAAIRARAPLVHNIANFVAMDLVANVLSAVGATPAIVLSQEEAQDFMALADVLTVNLGTPSSAAVDAMAMAAREAMAQGKPWVLDPAGAGSTPFRDDAARRLAGLKPSIIRGNGSEILALGGGGGPRGLDPEPESLEALDAARELAADTGAVVAVTGTVDYVTDGRRILAVANGHRLMGRVPAIGCGLTGLMGACCAVDEPPLVAAAHATAILGVAGELAAEEARGPASFRIALIDRLYNLDEATLNGAARID